MTELYVMTRYLRPDLLEDCSCARFDDWAATFGQIKTQNKKTATGELKLKTCFAGFNRMTVIPFEYSIPPKEQDKQLLEKLMAERDVVFSLAAKSLKGFIESGYDFKMSAKGKAYLENRIVSLHSVEEFLDEKTVVDEKGSVVGEILYEMLKEWCKGNMQTPVNSSEFKERVIAYAPNIEPKKVGDKNHRRAGFKGIRLKTAEELNAPDDSEEK